MKKIFLILFSFIFLTFLLLTNCTGVNGNPIELIGVWVAEWSETNNTNVKTKYEATVTFNDDGTFTLEYESDNGTTKDEYEYEGNYYGDPSNTPKTLTLEVTSYEHKEDGVKQEDDKDKMSYTGQYSIIYTSPYKLTMVIPSVSFDNGVYTKQ